MSTAIELQPVGQSFLHQPPPPPYDAPDHSLALVSAATASPSSRPCLKGVSTGYRRVEAMSVCLLCLSSSSTATEAACCGLFLCHLCTESSPLACPVCHRRRDATTPLLLAAPSEEEEAEADADADADADAASEDDPHTAAGQTQAAILSERHAEQLESLNRMMGRYEAELASDGSGDLVHVITHVDTLPGLAFRYGVPINAIKEANGLYYRNLNELEFVRIPGGAASEAGRVLTTATATSSSGTVGSPDASRSTLALAATTAVSEADLEELRQKRLVQLFVVATGASAEEALFYLDDADFDSAVALSAYHGDLEWARDHPMPASSAGSDRRRRRRRRQQQQERRSDRGGIKGKDGFEATYGDAAEAGRGGGGTLAGIKRAWRRFIN